MDGIDQSDRKKKGKSLRDSVSGLKFLILDDFTTKMVSSVMKMKDLLVDGEVIDVRHIKMSEQEPNTMPVIYFLAPRKDNLLRIISHYETKGGGPAQYGNIYLFFTSYCSDEKLNLIRNSAAVMRELKALKEVNCGFIRVNDYAFDINAFQCFSMYFDPKSRHLRDSTYLTKLATQILSLSVQLGHFPEKVRYLNSFSGELNQEFARELKRLMKLFQLENRENMKWNNVDCTILIIDRSFDTITPVLHDLTMEALARDYLAIGLTGSDAYGLHQNEYVYSVETCEEEKVERILYLDDSNEFWRQVRYSSIVEAMLTVQKLIEDLKNQEKLEQGKVKELSLTKLRDLMSKYPEQRRFKEMIGALSHLVDHTIQLYIKAVIECEQYLACHLEQKQGDLKNWKIVQEILRENNEGVLGRHLSLNERIRLLYLYGRSLSAVGGISIDELLIRFEEADIPENYLPIFANMDYMGTPIVSQSGQWAKFEDQNRDWTKELSCEYQKKTPIRPDKVPSVIDWCPNIYHLVKEFAENPHYNFDKFPSIEVKPKPFGQQLKVKHHEEVSDLLHKKLTERSSIIVFIAGGMTYGEAKYAPILNEYFEQKGGPFIFLGSSQLFNPDDFLERVNDINCLVKYHSDYGPTPAQRAALIEPVRYGLLRKKSFPPSGFHGATAGPVRASDLKQNAKRMPKKKIAAGDRRSRGSVTSFLTLTNRVALGIDLTYNKDLFKKELAEELYGKSGEVADKEPRTVPAAEIQGRDQQESYKESSPVQDPSKGESLAQKPTECEQPNHNDYDYVAPTSKGSTGKSNSETQKT